MKPEKPNENRGAKPKSKPKSKTKVNDVVKKMINRRIISMMPTPHPSDLKMQFGDGEVFLVDGDSLLLATFCNSDFQFDPCLGPNSLYVIWLMEKSIWHLQQRGGKPTLIFFRDMEQIWLQFHPALKLIRQIVQRHFDENVESVVVQSDFSNAGDSDFVDFLKRECVIFAMLASPDEQGIPFWGQPEDDTWIMQFQLQISMFLLHGVNVGEILSSEVSISSLNGFYFASRGLGMLDRDQKLKFCTKQFEQNLKLFAATKIDKNCEREMDSLAKNIFRFALCCQSSKLLPLQIWKEVREHHISFKKNEALDLEYRKYCLVMSLGVSEFPSAILPTLLSPLWIKWVTFFLEKDPKKLLKLSEQSELQVVSKLLHVDMSHLFNKQKQSPEYFKLLSLCTLEKEAEQNALFSVDHSLYEQYVGSLNTEFVLPSLKNARQFEEKYHWHVFRKITDDFHHVLDSSKNAQKEAVFYEQYGTSITGGSVSSKPIVVEKRLKKAKAKTTKPIRKGSELEQPKTMKTAQKLVCDKEIKNAEEELQKVQFSSELSLELKIKRIARVSEKLVTELEKKDISWESDERVVTLYNKCKVFEINTMVEKASELFSSVEADANTKNKTEYILMVKKILNCDTKISKVAKEKLAFQLNEMGFGKFVKQHLGEIAIESKNTNNSLARFQLANMGKHLVMERMKERDPRIDHFVPDQWQRDLFDAIDNKQSVLVIAPTSSGKTYACYYCMEQVLRESNDGIVIYVAPTKALVNQVSATIYANFSKRKDYRGTGKTLFGTFTRDYRANATNCQILVTVPQCLNILLFSPTQSEWCDKIRYVIFDEVHNIGGEGDSSVWEHDLLAIRCPFLALSATVSNPADLCNWLQKFEDFKKLQDEELGVKIREPSSYQVKLVEFSDRHADLVKHVTNFDEAGEMSFDKIHPLAFLKATDILSQRGIPSHVTLSPKESLQLHDALVDIGKLSTDGPLSPSQYFTERFLDRNDIKNYTRDLYKVVVTLSEGELNHMLFLLGSEQKKLFLNPKENITNLLKKLKDDKLLPAILFSFDRSLCEVTAMQGCEDVMKAIEEDQENNPNRVLRRSEKVFRSSDVERRESKKDKDKILIDFKVSTKKAIDAHLFRDPMDFFNEFFQDYPDLLFVGAHCVGQKEAGYILNRMKNDTESGYAKCLQMGLTWHHSGNSRPERLSSEMLFHKKFVQLVASTSTLAQGIHMPCKTVVFVEDSIYLNTLCYHQCAGRAGRRGYDTEGNVIFYNVRPTKIARLMTAPLPKIQGNEPVSMAFILRMLVFLTSTDNQDRKKRPERIAKVLCLLECPFILQARPDMAQQVRFFFLFAIDFLVSQGYINHKGESIGLAGLASHLHYHEPYNFALCHFLLNGNLKQFCHKNSKGNFTPGTMKSLLHIVAFLFGRIPLNMNNYRSRKEENLFSNSKVLMDPIPLDVKTCLEEFNSSLREAFSNFLRCAKKLAKFEGGLPLSKFQFSESFEMPKHVNNLFVEREPKDMKMIKNLVSNVGRYLQTSFVPLIDLETPLNNYIMDFFQNGSLKELERDNGLPAGRSYQAIKDVSLTLSSIHTSLLEAKIDEIDQTVVEAFGELKKQFQEKFEDSYEGTTHQDRRYLKKPRGSVKIHAKNCLVCDQIKEGSKVLSKNKAPFSTRGFGLDCECWPVIFSVWCGQCTKLFVQESLTPLKEKFSYEKTVGSKEVDRLLTCLRVHGAKIQILDKEPQEKLRKNELQKWISKLKAEK